MYHLRADLTQGKVSDDGTLCVAFMHLKISPFSSPDWLTCLLVKVIIIFHSETFSLKTTIFRFAFSRHAWLQFMSRHFWPSGWPHTVNTFQRSQHFYLADKLLLTKCRCCARSKWWTGIKNEITETLDWAERHRQYGQSYELLLTYKLNRGLRPQPACM